MFGNYVEGITSRAQLFIIGVVNIRWPYEPPHPLETPSGPTVRIPI